MTIFPSSLFFMALTLVLSGGWLFVKNVFPFGLIWHFLMIRCRLCIWGLNTASSGHLIRSWVMSMYLLLVMLTLITWFRWCLLGFPTVLVQLLGFPLQFINILGGEALWLSCFSTNFHPLILAFGGGSHPQQLLLWCSPNGIHTHFIHETYEVHRAGAFCPRSQKPWPSFAQHPATAPISVKGKAEVLTWAPKTPPTPTPNWAPMTSLTLFITPLGLTHTLWTTVASLLFLENAPTSRTPSFP